MSQVTLDPRLDADTHVMGAFGDTAVLLLGNAHYPWLILVPNTDETEFHRLPAAQQAVLMAQASRLAEFIESWCAIDKINIAAIGNVVSQLHVHVIGRRKTDPSWPGVVWGASAFVAYEAAEQALLQQQLGEFLGGDFTVQP